jgi:hypothetical protein
MKVDTGGNVPPPAVGDVMVPEADDISDVVTVTTRYSSHPHPAPAAGTKVV